MDVSKPVLVISDLQICYENEKAFDFCKYIKRNYRIPDENICNVGDEIDIMNGGQYDKDPDSMESPVNEIQISRERIKQWASEFPLMKLCISNHGLRWVKKATAAQIPSQVLKDYKDIYQMPEGWEWREEWVFNKFKHPWRMIHGMGYSGINGHRNAVIDSGISTVIGHLHSFAAISHIKMMGSKMLWGMNVGCLINENAVAFKYGKYNRPKPCLGVGLVANNGSTPIWIPLEF